MAKVRNRVTLRSGRSAIRLIAVSNDAATAELSALSDDAVVGVEQAAILLGVPASLARRLAIRSDWTGGIVQDYRLRGQRDEAGEWFFTVGEAKRAKRALTRERKRLEQLPDDEEVGVEEASLFLQIGAFRIRQVTAIADPATGKASFRSTVRDPLRVVDLDDVPPHRLRARKVSALIVSAPLAYKIGELRRFKKVVRPPHRPVDPTSQRRRRKSAA